VNLELGGYAGMKRKPAQRDVLASVGCDLGPQEWMDGNGFEWAVRASAGFPIERHPVHFVQFFELLLGLVDFPVFLVDSAERFEPLFSHPEFLLGDDIPFVWTELREDTGKKGDNLERVPDYFDMCRRVRGCFQGNDDAGVDAGVRPTDVGQLEGFNKDVEKSFRSL